MISIKVDKAIENAEELKETLSSSKVLVQSFKILKPDKKNIWRKSIFLLIDIIIGIIVVKQADTIALTKDIFELFITILIALVAIVFTGYSFFQALINDRLLITLLSVDDEHGNLYGTNKYFAEVMIFQIACLLVDILLVIFMIIVPKNWCAFDNNQANEWISGIALVFLLHCNIESIWEMKSFIFNVFQLFNLHAYARISEINDNEKKINKLL